MKLYDALSSLITFFALISIMGLVFANNRKSKVNQSFIVFGIVIFVCLIFISLTNYQTSYNHVLLLTRYSVAVSNFIPVTFLSFVLALIGIEKIFNKKILITLIAAIFIACTAFLPGSVKSVANISGGNPTGTGPLLWLLLINFVVVFGYSTYVLINYRKNADSYKKAQINIIAFFSITLITFNMVAQIVLPEFHIILHENTLTNPTVLLFVGAIAYSIIKHKLFDIKSVILRTFGFIFTLLVVLVTFFTILLGPVRVIFPHLNLNLAEELYFIGSAVLLAFLFNPLRHFLEKITNRFFFQDRYNSEELVNNISKILASEVRLIKMSEMIVTSLKNRMHIQGVDILVLNEGKIYYESCNYYETMLDEVRDDLVNIKEEVLSTDNLKDGPEKDILIKYGIQVLAQLKVQNDQVGYIIFSKKVSGSPYTKKDLLVIDIIADELSIAIQNSRAYDQISQFNASLQRKVEEATNQLLLSNDALKKASSTKDDFISMVSHQLGTPLSVMDGFLTLIIQGFYGKDAVKINEALKKALSRTRVMKNLVFDLLNISRMTAGKFFLEISSVDLNEVVEDEVNQLEVEAKDKNVQLVFYKPKNPVPKLQLDEPKTRQAIMNLINNAIFYSPQGKVEVYLTSDDQNITFKVVDNGIGVPDDQKDQLFTKFFRADNAVRESPNGTGIGLYLVKRVIEDQHGRLIFDSEVKKGSTFGFNIPITTVNDDITEKVKSDVEAIIN